jgi:hypothetical protein
MNATFMLLTWGANPNAEDQNGICPLLWLLQNNNTTRGFEMSKLLIQFGATVTCTEPRTKNSLLHFLAQSKKFDLIQAFYFYHNNPGFFRLASNAAGQSVYKLATMSENRKMAKFLLDATLFHMLPTWIPTALIAILWVLYYILLYLQGFIYGTCLWLVLAGTALWGLGQHYIIPHRDRMFLGSYIGFAFIASLCFETYIVDIVSVWTRLWLITMAVVTGYLAWQVHRTRPQTAIKDMQVDLSQRIIDSAPSEGTDEENQELVEFSRRQQQASQQQSGSNNMRLQVVKDAFTGRVSVVRQKIVSGDDDYDTSKSHSQNSSHHHKHTDAIVRLRSLGPRLCGHCLTDKRCIEVLSNTGRRQISNQSDSLHGNSSSHMHQNSSTGTPKTAISIANHCTYCQACILDQDHHCAYLNVCIGRGNRRLFVLFQLALSLTCFTYFFTSRFLLFDTLCDPLLTSSSASVPTSTWSLSVMWTAEICVWSKFAHFAFVQYLVGLLAVYAGMVGYIQCVLVMKETTLHNLVKHRAPLLDAQRRSQLPTNLWNFLWTGRYTVVYPRNLQSNAAASSSTSAAASNLSVNSNAMNSNGAEAAMNNREGNTTGGVRSMLSALSATVKNPSTASTASVSDTKTNSQSDAKPTSMVSRLWQRLEQEQQQQTSSHYPDDDHDTDETPLLYQSDSQKQQQHVHHRQRNGSFTTSEPPTAPSVSTSSKSNKSKKKVSFANHNQYDSPPTALTTSPALSRNSSTIGGLLSVVTNMPPKFPILDTANAQNDSTLSRDLEQGRSNGSEEDPESDEDGEDSTGDYIEEDDDYDPEFVDSDLNGYYGHGRSLEDEEELFQLQQYQKEMGSHHQHHHHGHDHTHDHDHHHHNGKRHSSGDRSYELEDGTKAKVSDKLSTMGVESFKGQSWVR